MWSIELVEILRVMIHDVETIPTLSDSRLQSVLLVAALQVKQDLKQDLKYRVNITTQTIAPDPCDEATRDDAYANLITIKAACILDRGSAMDAANSAISITSGKHSFDVRDQIKGKLALLKDGWCKVFEDTKFEYLNASINAVAGNAIMTPFRLYALNRQLDRAVYPF